MYRWKITSFMVFSTLFWSVSMLSASLTWLALTWILEAPVRVKEEPVKDESVKSELGDTSDESVKKEESEMLLSSYPVEGEAVGSGLESAAARGVQKRRSHT